MDRINSLLFASCLLFQVSCHEIEVVGNSESKDDQNPSFANTDVPSDFDWNIYK